MEMLLEYTHFFMQIRDIDIMGCSGEVAGGGTNLKNKREHNLISKFRFPVKNFVLCVTHPCSHPHTNNTEFWTQTCATPKKWEEEGKCASAKPRTWVNYNMYLSTIDFFFFRDFNLLLVVMWTASGFIDGYHRKGLLCHPRNQTWRVTGRNQDCLQKTST